MESVINTSKKKKSSSPEESTGEGLRAPVGKDAPGEARTHNLSITRARTPRKYRALTDCATGVPAPTSGHWLLSPALARVAVAPEPGDWVQPRGPRATPPAGTEPHCSPNEERTLPRRPGGPGAGQPPGAARVPEPCCPGLQAPGGTGSWRRARALSLFFPPEVKRPSAPRGSGCDL